MKRITLILLLTAVADFVFAQDNTFPAQGNVGVGTLNPQAKLDVKGNIQISSAEIPLGFNTEVGGTVPLFNMSVNFREANKNNAFVGAAFRIDARTSYMPLFQWLKRDAGTEVESVLMNLSDNGNLGLGIISPSEKLSVNGNIRAREIKVEAAHWPDYVFHEQYQLQSLQGIADFIKANKHLPEIPSAFEIEKEGAPLGEMNKLLLKKIEELTLHLINLDKKVTVLEKENRKLNKIKNEK